MGSDGGGADGSKLFQQLAAVDAIVGREEENAVHVRKAIGGRIVAAEKDVLDKCRAGFGAVALPQLGSVGIIVGLEVEGAVDVGEVSLDSEPPPPALMSLTNTVPVSVPSLFHSSKPLVLLSATKNSVPFTFVRLKGIESPRKKMSLTITVPASVPSLLKSSLPPTAWSHSKKRVPFTFVKAVGKPHPAQGLATRTVPASVPSLFHSSPSVEMPSLAPKNSVPFTFVSWNRN